MQKNTMLITILSYNTYLTVLQDYSVSFECQNESSKIEKEVPHNSDFYKLLYFLAWHKRENHTKTEKAVNIIP